MKVYIQSFAGSKLWEKTMRFVFPANESGVLLEVSDDQIGKLISENSIMVCEIDGDFEGDRAFYYGCMPHRIKLRDVELRWKLLEECGKGAIIISSDGYARVVTLTGNAVFSDNYFDLLPGEVKTVQWYLLEGKKGEINVSCWNIKQKEA